MLILDFHWHALATCSSADRVYLHQLQFSVI